MKNVLIVSFLFLVSVFAYGQTVKSIEAKAVENKIQIDFKIAGLKYNQNILNIDVFVKRVGDKQFEGPMEFVSGDIKSGLRNGDHTIYWDALKEMLIEDAELIFDVRIMVEEEDIVRKFMVMLAGNTLTPLGLRLGQLGKTSWYVEARASLQALETTAYTYSKDGILDYDQTGYYELSGNNGWQAYSIVAGVTKQVHRHVFLYAGLGYGVENYIIEINNYTYDSQAPVSNSWANYKEYSTSGIEIDAGVIMNYKRL
ncbi:MAG: hypothetical protein B7C24_17955, partial [Bacteroidetes bacterium 4572_77]